MPVATRSIRTLLEGMIDYAGLFAPAQLEMGPAVQNYSRYRAGDCAWALGRFVVPSSRLDEFEGAAAALLPVERDAAPWPVSLLGSADRAHDAELIFAFNERHAHASAGRAVIDTLEVKAADTDGLEEAIRSAPAGVTTYIEIPIAGDPSDLVAAIANHGARAKVRTGGVTPDAFPSTRDLARFIRLAADQGVPFKATAGLHHPIRASHRLTYAPDSPRGMMYGFLNVFLAAAFAQAGLSISELELLLEETDADSIAFDARGVTWHRLYADLDAITRLRARVAVSFGSCSFTEPIDELRALGLLPKAS